MSPEPFDFRRPPGPDHGLLARIESWLAGLCKVGPERLATVLGSPPELAAGKVEAATLRSIVESWQQPMVGCWVVFNGLDDATLLLMPRALAVTYVGLMLGIELPAGDEAQADRPLTSVEQGLVELLLTEICAALGESWPESDVPELRVEQFEPRPDRSKRVPGSADMTAIGFDVTVGDHTAAMQWLWPQSVRENVQGETRSGARPSADDRRRLEQLVREVPVEVVVKLGEARLHLRDLAQLKEGDVIVLNKKLGQPLEAVVGARSRFSGWPGRIGNQQAYQIADLMGPNAGADVLEGGHSDE